MVANCVFVLIHATIDEYGLSHFAVSWLAAYSTYKTQSVEEINGVMEPRRSSATADDYFLTTTSLSELRMLTWPVLPMKCWTKGWLRWHNYSVIKIKKTPPGYLPSHAPISLQQGVTGLIIQD